ncbi:hypothetical protein PQY04_002189 [Salmonella enterica]|uniref:Uncharacterized protein n=4 Tax=Salmonella enterica TaxID=28901 RepID=A0A379SYL3_SALER|nr:hypothetical protein [Salmonella enterica]EAA8484278.1 hypothetical protein [Salmonella enterica subsp. enterica serovar Newport]ECH9068997.1 hypothetical protein [Salmonella enterica subsp. enterica]EDP9433272.1 hypothetical protein [Salmonella enterica subsp. diarizonae]EDQ1018131.1 hypothetical protein [Salmonella enterica subsp. houtenae serovar 50:z4,z23:-]EDQ2286689.1 hypothetical protein [Salmonella enterica subsp. arizonae]EDV3253442.1 hypothetical protein [Salmonella enterica subs
MIFLRTENGSQKVEDWEVITSRPNFVAKIAKGDHQFEEIIGYYKFKEEIHCGLTGCNQPHQMGYIVKTSSGIETNIGNKCGKNEFGVEFGENVLSFNKFMQLETNREIILTAKDRCDIWQKNIETLRNIKPTIDHLSFAIEKSKNSNFSGRLGAAEMRLLEKSQTSIVTLSEVETDKKTRTILFAMNKHMRESGEATNEYEMGKVSFTHVLLPENDLRNLYVSINEDLKKIRNLDIQTAPSPELSEIARISSTIEERIKQLKNLKHQASKFLTKKNLFPIANKIKYSSTAEEIDLQNFISFLNWLK